jgi:hypothetical protein
MFSVDKIDDAPISDIYILSHLPSKADAVFSYVHLILPRGAAVSVSKYSVVETCLVSGD